MGEKSKSFGGYAIDSLFNLVAGKIRSIFSNRPRVGNCCDIDEFEKTFLCNSVKAYQDEYSRKRDFHYHLDIKTQIFLGIAGVYLGSTILFYEHLPSDATVYFRLFLLLAMLVPISSIICGFKALAQQLVKDPPGGHLHRTIAEDLIGIKNEEEHATLMRMFVTEIMGYWKESLETEHRLIAVKTKWMNRCRFLLMVSTGVLLLFMILVLFCCDRF